MSGLPLLQESLCTDPPTHFLPRFWAQETPGGSQDKASIGKRRRSNPMALILERKRAFKSRARVALLGCFVGLFCFAEIRR